MPRALVIMARAPERGRVKTRLAAELGEAAALAIYRDLGAHVLEAVWRVRDCSITVAFTPAYAGDLTRAWLEREGEGEGGDRVRYEPQIEGDLGARMAGAIRARLSAGAERVVVIGTDCPQVDEHVIEQAFAALDTADVVFGPAADGGYYLIGMRRFHSELFAGIPWSSERTLERTLEAARATGLRVHLLPVLVDIDTAADWWRWTGRR